MVLLVSNGVRVIFAYLFFFVAIFSSIVPTTSQVTAYLEPTICAYSNGNYTQNSTYSSNLLAAFANLSSLSASNFFSSVTVGSHADTVYALYDCREDLRLQTCHDCVVDAAKTLLQLCLTKEAVTYYEECTLRYANRMIFSTMEVTNVYVNFFYSIPTLPDRGKINKTVGKVFERLMDIATSNSSWLNFTSGVMDYIMYQRIYGLVECTPDLSREQCKECLMEALYIVAGYCASDSRILCEVRAPSCRMEYRVVSTLNMTYGLPPIASPPDVTPVLRNNGGGERLISIHHMLSILLFNFVFFCCN